MDDLQKISSMSKAKHVLFLVDACYGGLAAVGSRGLNPSTPNFIEKILRDKARQIITAGGRGERVIEKAEWGHSAFTKNILRGLKEGFADMNLDGMITGEELGLFLKEKVSIDSDLRQTPQSRRFGSYEGEIVFNNVALTNKIKNDKNDKRNDGEIITLFSEQLKQSHELNKLLLEQIKNLDNENNNENDQMLKINTKFPEVSYNNSLINNSKISGILYHSFPGLGHLYSNDYKMGLFWSSIFTSSLISNYLIYNGTKEKQLEYDKSVSNYDSADRNFDLLKLQAQNSSKELSKSKTLFYTSCIVSSYIWYKSGSKYRRNININITGNRVLLSISI